MKHLVAGLLVALVVAACEDATMPAMLEVATVSIDQTSTSVLAGATVQFTLDVRATNGSPVTGEVVTWLSSDESVATVDSTGLVTGLEPGSVAITAVAGGFAASAVVQVWKPAEVLTAVDDGVAPLVREFTIDLDREDPIRIDYWTTDTPRLRVRSSSTATHHVIKIARLLPNAVYDYEVRAIGPDDLLGVPHTGTFVSDTLPAGLAEVTFTNTTGASTVPLVMLELRAPSYTGFVIVDTKGRVVWHYKTLQGPQGSARMPNGDFAFVQRASRLSVVSPFGEVVSEQSDGADAHHDVVVTPQNTLLYLSFDAERTVNDTLWIGDRIWEWDPKSGVAQPRWDTFDFYDVVADRAPRSRENDWGHANSLAYGPRGNLVVSFNFLNQIISLTPDLQTVEWKLGGIGSDYWSAPENVFTGQHTAAEISPGRVLLFDNGAERVNIDEYSRGIELALHDASEVVTRAWQFRPSTDNFARIISSAFRMDNGNTLVHFGTSGPFGNTATGGPIETYEVTSDGQVVWHLLTENANTAYRANPLSHIANEVEVPQG